MTARGIIQHRTKANALPNLQEVQRIWLNLHKKSKRNIDKRYYMEVIEIIKSLTNKNTACEREFKLLGYNCGKCAYCKKHKLKAKTEIEGWE